MGDPVGKHKKKPLYPTLVTKRAKGYDGTSGKKVKRTLISGHKRNGVSGPTNRLEAFMLNNEFSIGSIYQLVLFASATDEERIIFFKYIQYFEDLGLSVCKEDPSNLSDSLHEENVESYFLVTTSGHEEFNVLVPIQAPFMALHKKTESFEESSESIEDYEDYVLASISELDVVDERILKNQAAVRQMKKDARHDLSALEKAVKELEKVSEK